MVGLLGEYCDGQQAAKLFLERASMDMEPWCGGWTVPLMKSIQNGPSSDEILCRTAHLRAEMS